METFEEKLSCLRSSIDNHIYCFFEKVSTQEISVLFPRTLNTIIFEEVRSLVTNGGKRIRSAILIHGAALFDEHALEKSVIYQAAIALELLHASYLIYDDIIDDDAMRRGYPSTHINLAQHVGDEKKGKNLAILAAILASALSQYIITKLPIEPHLHIKLLNVYADMQTFCIEGGVYELTENVDPISTAEQKTSGYTTMGPLLLGAILGGATQHDLRELSKAASDLGVAFQLQDDLLNAFGKTCNTGKPIGSDLRNGQKTWLFKQGMELANKNDRKILSAAIGNINASNKLIKQAHSILERCGARKACQKRIDLLNQNFITFIEKSNYQKSACSFFCNLVLAIANRIS